MREPLRFNAASDVKHNYRTDYNIQVTITEALCRMTTKKLRENFAQKWFEDRFFGEAFKEINDKDFETDCRKFLNSVNSRLEETKRVHTFPCISVSTDMGELTKPQDDKLEHFWIDFNVGSESISFYIHQNKDYLWESVRLQKESLSGYSLEECSGQKLLSIHLQIPHCIDNKEIKCIMIKFELEHDIQNAAIKTYGEDLQMKVHIASPQQTDKLQAGLTDCQKVVCIEEQESAAVVSDSTRVLEFIEENKPSEVSSKNSILTTSETRRHHLKQQPAEK
ncbi:synaptonemal complex protein 2-like [Bufo gargarizans]|uniref:synaptonemal complex protein 2-like n=1 Tax=Bufo gargarizans TaxID=30331 RepID=UPI001CF1D4F4|nr:synaptonemal complex protein 2-like [Bufo gargarizans]